MSTNYKQLFESYRWRLRKIDALEAELRKIRQDMDEGVASRYSVDSNCEQNLIEEIADQKEQLKWIDGIIDGIPETKQLLPCKLYLRLHYVSGYTLTNTAAEMGVSLSTIDRIRKRCADYFGF